MMPKCTYLLILLSLAIDPAIKSAFTKRHPSPNWDEILPDIVRDVLPEEARKKFDEILPPQVDDSRKKATRKNGVDEYYGKTTLKGKLFSPTRIYGAGTLQAVWAKENIEIKGSATIENSQVSSVRVEGSLQGKDSTFEKLETNGSSDLNNCTILQTATIYGRLTAHKSNFHGPLYVFSSSLTLKDSKVHDIKLMSNSKKQNIFLEGTEVKGNILFENEPGVVILRKNSRIRGNVKNGEIKAE